MKKKSLKQSQPEETAGKETAAEKEKALLLAVDFKGLEGAGRSVPFMIWSRLCPTSQEEKALVKQRAAGSVTKLLDQIARCCSHKPDYITPKTPILEAVFRLLLAKKNASQSAHQIVEGLKEREYPLEGAEDNVIQKLEMMAHGDDLYRIRTVQ